jgi:hypothetical protein
VPVALQPFPKHTLTLGVVVFRVVEAPVLVNGFVPVEMATYEHFMSLQALIDEGVLGPVGYGGTLVGTDGFEEILSGA